MQIIKKQAVSPSKETTACFFISTQSTLTRYIMSNDSIALNRNGIEIVFSKTEPISLTKLWKMAGSPDNKNPYEWKRLPETKKLIKQVTKEVNTEKSRNGSQQGSQDEPKVIQTIRGGNDPQTLAHYKLALEYAGYLSVEFKSWMLEVIGDLIAEPEKFAADILINSHNKERVERAKQRVLVSGTNKQTMELASLTGTPYAQVHNDRYRGLYRKNAKQLREDGGLDKNETPLDALSTYDLTLNSLANQRAKMMGNPNAIFSVANTLREGHEKDMGKPLTPTWEEKRLRPNQARSIAYDRNYQNELPFS